MKTFKKIIAELTRKEQEITKVATICGDENIQKGVENAIKALAITTQYPVELYAAALYEHVAQKGELPQNVIINFFSAGAPYIV